MNSDPETIAKFAAERSHRISQVANEHSRATSQTCVLINGGAATAMLALLAKDGIDASLVAQMPKCLVGYALGVFFGAVMMWCMTQTLEQWNLFWYFRAHKEEETVKSNESAAKISAHRWTTAYNWCFVLSVLSFVVSSVVMAGILYLGHSAPSAKAALLNV